MPKYSFIIPVYNAEEFLGKSVGSVLSQTVDDWELLLIDDGSVDSSKRICREYSEKDSRIIFIDKDGGGVSDTRNRGLERASGEYIVFVDADDYITADYLEKADAAMSGKDADLLIMNYYETDGTTAKKGRAISDELCKTVCRDIKPQIKYFLEFIYPHKICYGSYRPVWAKVFKNSIIKENGLLFNTGLKIGEDALFFVRYLMRAKGVLFSNDYVYYYRNNPASAMNNKKWEGAAAGEYYFGEVEGVTRESASELSLAKFWFNIAENDWRVLCGEPCKASFKTKTLKKLFKTGLYRRFSKKSTAKGYGKKQRLEAFFIRNGLARCMVWLYAFLLRKAPKKKRICKVFVNFFAQKNYGDDAFVLRLLERYPNVEFILKGKAENLTAFENYSNAVLKKDSRLREALNKAEKKLTKKNFLIWLYSRGCKARVTIGGSIFIEPPERYYQTYLRDRSALYVPGKVNMIIGANFGPYKKDSFREFFRREFARYDDVTFRDRDSYSLFEGVESVRYAPDILFGLEALDKHTEGTESGYVVVSVIDSADDRAAYAGKVAELVEYYKRNGLRTVLLSLCGAQGDTALCREINSLCGGKAEIVSYDGDVNKIINIIKRADYVVAARFHAVVTSLVYGVPCFPVVYSNKTENMLTDVGFGGKTVKVDEFAGLSCEEIDLNRVNNYTVDVKEQIIGSEKHFEKLDSLLR